MPPRSLTRVLADAAASGGVAMGAAVPPAGATDPVITAVAQSHSQVTAGALFVARRGAAFDAHELIPAAVANGAVAVVGERPRHQVDVPPTIPYIQVTDARAALPHLAAAFFGHPSRRMSVTGVTGTDGKTTTSYLLHWLLSEHHTAGLISTAGVRLGLLTLPTEGHFTTPEATEVQALLARFMAGGVTHVVLESSSHGFSQHRLDAVDYDVGVFTNLSSEHLDHHGTWENYREAKATLMRRARTSVINADDPEAAYFTAAALPAHGSGRVLTYGSRADADLRIDSVTTTGPRLALAYRLRGTTLRGTLPMPGRYNASNAAAALAAAAELGVEPAAAMARLADFPGVPGRMQLVQEQPFTVVVDFAHTPPALAKAIEAVKPAMGGRVVVVIGAAGERDPGKRAGLGSVAAQNADLSVFTEEDSRSEPIDAILNEMARGARARGAVADRDFLLVPDRTAAIETALRAARPGDVVLLAGKGHETTLERLSETLPWDEVGVVSELLERL